jgi:membrane associated rhomboid family serine protease
MFSRFIFWTSIAIYAASFMFYQALYYTINSPLFIVPGMQIWRLVTAPFANIDIFMLLFGLLSYLMRGYQIEKEKGTAKFIIYFMFLSILSQIFMVIIGFLFIKAFGIPAMSFGLWTMTMAEMTIDSLRDPEMSKNFC